MEKRFCTSCGEAFEPRAQSPKQAYCSKELCQRAEGPFGRKHAEELTPTTTRTSLTPKKHGPLTATHISHQLTDKYEGNPQLRSPACTDDV